jgi:TonB family protein
MRFVLAVSFAVFLVAADQPQSIQARQPTGKWTVDYADRMCTLQREYGVQGRPLTLGFQPYPLSGNMVVLIIDSARHRPPDSVSGEIGFGPGTQRVKTTVESIDLKAMPVRFNRTWLKRSELEQAAATNLITLTAGKHLNETFAVPRLAAALKALDACVVDLVEDWGISRTEQARMASNAEPIGALVNSNDYPSGALDKNEMGSTSARVKVDAAGRPSDCVVVGSSGSRQLDSTTCRVLLRARYTPARDKSGQPMNSLYYARLGWRIFG